MLIFSLLWSSRIISNIETVIISTLHIKLILFLFHYNPVKTEQRRAGGYPESRVAGSSLWYGLVTRRQTTDHHPNPLFPKGRVNRGPSPTQRQAPTLTLIFSGVIESQIINVTKSEEFNNKSKGADIIMTGIKISHFLKS